MSQIFQFNYWFNLRPGNLTPGAQTGFFVFLIILAVLIFVFFLFKSRYKKSSYFRIWRNLYSFCLSNLIIGLFLLLFTYELVPFLSARFWFLLWGLGMAVWLFFIGRFLVLIPKIKQKIATEKEYQKYIP